MLNPTVPLKQRPFVSQNKQNALMLTYCKGLFVLVWGYKLEQTAQKAAIHSTQTQPWTVYFMILGRIGLGEHSTQKLSKSRGKHSFKNDKCMFEHCVPQCT